MRFIIIGAGGVGGCFGASLARAGHDVTIFARGEHLAVIRRDGLTVRTPSGTEVVPLAAVGDLAQVPSVDVAVVAVKSYSLRDVIAAARTAAERGAHVVPLLNGVTAADDLVAGGVRRSSVLGGLARVSAARIAPGVVERYSTFQSMVVGEVGGGSSERATAIAAAFAGAGVDARASDAIDIELWQKFVFITALAAVCGLARAPVGPVRDAPGGRRFIERAVGEVVAVARARGVALPEDETAKTVAYIHTLPAAMKPSFLMDLESGGRTELETLSGTVARFAALAGIDAPVHETAAAALGVDRS